MIAFLGFKTISVARKLTLAGGALVAATVGVLMQSNYAWYMPLLALIGISLLSALVFMKILEKEQKEKVLEAEERKAYRSQLITAASSAHLSSTQAKEEDMKLLEKSKNSSNERETIQVTEKISMPEPVKMPQMEKEPEKEPERVKELVGAKPFGMQSIKPVGKEDQGEQ
ncbi:hypothetical protein QWY15_06615 [Planococcus sp. N064]|uniref:MFS transporter n=1 Tax=Planococcus liqunii TaxID=3058394 RepID=A0ABT8MPY8_9BACL|nr:hypothetical protein [Planococcus sp. N064]MDN7226969.1 hypothetical protein [Planococcus sp. N064]